MVYKTVDLSVCKDTTIVNGVIYYSTQGMTGYTNWKRLLLLLRVLLLLLYMSIPCANCPAIAENVDSTVCSINRSSFHHLVATVVRVVTLLATLGRGKILVILEKKKDTICIP